MYSIKEIFIHSRVRVRTLAGQQYSVVSLVVTMVWKGKDRDRAICKFCDTDFVGTDGTMGGQYKTAEALVEAMQGLWPNNQKKKVCSSNRRRATSAG